MLKSFDKIEKDTINRLVSEKQSGHPILLGNVFDNIFPNQYIKIDKSQSTVEIMYENNSKNPQVEEDQGLLATIILLMSFLEKTDISAFLIALIFPHQYTPLDRVYLTSVLFRILSLTKMLQTGC